MQSIDVFGFSFAKGPKVDLLSEITARLRAGERLSVATPNPEILLRAYRDAAFASTLRAFDIRIMDAIGPVLLSRLLGRREPERMPGVDFVVDLCSVAQTLGYSVFLLGNNTPPGSNAAARAVLAERFPGLRVLGTGEVIVSRTEHGWELPDLVLEEILAAGDCMLFVGLGMQKQEEWIGEHMKDLPNVRLAMGVGGSFAMIGGTIRRAPPFMRRVGLEWLWRLLIEPWRIGRIFRAVAAYPVAALFFALRHRGETH